MKANLIIVEDDPMIALDLQGIAENQGYTIKGVFHSGEEALLSPPLPIDLALLDITLEGTVDGIAVGLELRKKHRIPCLFITSYYDDATIQRATAAQPLAYILKPYEEAEIVANLHLCQSKLSSPVLQPNEGPIFVKSGGKLTRIHPEQVTHLQAYDMYTHLFMGDQKLLASHTLKELHHRLAAYPFVRVHRSHVVNINHIEGIFEDQVLIGTTRIPLGRTYKQALIDRIQLL